MSLELFEIYSHFSSSPNVAFVSLTSTLTASAVVSSYPQRPHNGEIAGWVVGGIVLVALTLISVFLLLRRKARVKEETELKYDSGQPEPGVLFVPNTDTPPISSQDNSSLGESVIPFSYSIYGCFDTLFSANMA